MNTLYSYKGFLRKVRSHLSEPARLTGLAYLHMNSLLLEKYVTYMEETMAGSHGKTAQFWINYAYLMDLYLIFHRAMKMNDTQLFAYVLCKISSIFCSKNYQNYAR